MTVFAIGAALYSAVEILWRGFTHWTMGLAGGICLCGIYTVNEKTCKSRLGKLALCAALITVVEFIFGLVVNVLLKLNVWDYSERRFNILGQICPLYTVLWFLLSAPAVALCNLLKNNLFKNVENR